MLSGSGQWLRKAGMLLALCAGGFTASAAPTPVAAQWHADEDEQFLLDVTIRNLRLGDGVRAYNTPEGTCVVLGDFLTTLDVPMRIDISAGKASGWAFREQNRISIDYAAGRASFGTASEAIAPGTIRETPEGWCVQASALARWFGIKVTPLTSGSALVLQSPTKLPVELAAEREQRAAHLQKASYDLGGLPQVRIPYRMWRTPALDFVVSGGLTYRASDGVEVDRQTSVFAAGEIAHLSYDAQISTSQKGIPNMVRVRAFRSDPDANLLGPLHATHFAAGDGEGFDSSLTGSSAAGRGAVITNRPLTSRAAFDRTRFEGDLPSGWEAEIYRNEELLGFARSDTSQRYVFDNVQLLYGDNQVRIVLYGPQGQVRTREEVINVGQDNVPAGKTWYWAGVNQSGRDLVSLDKPPDETQPRAQATLSLEHGIDERTSIGVLAREMLIDDQRLTFLEGTVRRSIGHALIEVGAAHDSTGGTAAHAQLLGRFGGVNVSAQALIANDFHLQGGISPLSQRQAQVAVDAPIHVGRTVLPVHGEFQFTDHNDGTSQLDAAARISANIDRFNLSTALHYQQQYLNSGTVPAELKLDFLGTGRVGDVRVRAGTTFDIAPSAAFETAEISAYWSKSDHLDWEGDLIYEASSSRVRARVTQVRRLNSFNLALTAEAASDGSLAFGFNLNFSLDPNQGLFFSRKPLAQAGSVRATVYRDLNDNGVHDANEPFEKGALVTTGTVQADAPTNDRGAVTVAGLTAYMPVAVGIDQTSLADPMLVPRQALQVVVPRPGVPAEVQIALVGAGDIEGALVKNGGMGFEGVDLELVGDGGKVAMTARTDFDGFFLFERVPYGHYSVRVAAKSAATARIGADLLSGINVTPEKPVVRLGALAARALPVVASATSGPQSALK